MHSQRSLHQFAALRSAHCDKLHWVKRVAPRTSAIGAKRSLRREERQFWPSVSGCEGAQFVHWLIPVKTSLSC